MQTTDIDQLIAARSRKRGVRRGPTPIRIGPLPKTEHEVLYLAVIVGVVMAMSLLYWNGGAAPDLGLPTAQTANPINYYLRLRVNEAMGDYSHDPERRWP